MPSETVAQENSAARIASPVSAAAPWRIKAVSVLPSHHLALAFMDGTNGTVDCSAVLNSQNPGIFALLKDPDYFARVQLELGALTWPNGADLDPAWLYDQVAGGKTWAVPF
jgi:hypothetical protein